MQVLSLADVGNGDEADGESEMTSRFGSARSAGGMSSGGAADSLDGEVDSDDDMSASSDSGALEGGCCSVEAVKFYFVSFTSLCGQLIFINGLWELLDVYVICTAHYTGTAIPGKVLAYRSTELNIMCVFAGLAMLLIGGAIMTNACLAVVRALFFSVLIIFLLQQSM